MKLFPFALYLSTVICLISTASTSTVSPDQPPQPSSSTQPPPLLSASPTNYSPNFLESLTDATITYLLPITLLLSLYNRKLSYLQFTVILYITSRLLRSLGRLANSQYQEFLSALEAAPHSETNLDRLRTTYDFEFSHFPVTHKSSVSVSDWDQAQNRTGGISYYVSWAVAHSFGIRLIYPGLILGGVLRGVLEDGRGKLVTEKNGKRIKLRVGSDEGGEVDVDAMVFDRREKKAEGWTGVMGKGEVLVICCEGNAGFYEIGMLGGALAEGYSVLGWNHPGFGGSTGVPYPTTELTACLAVMDYALKVLKFPESSIIIYGWSIGGFPATYLASRYPKIRGLLLDATFDSILPLAIPRMPEFMSSLVVSTINNHVNLDNDANLRHYSGPIRIVRRTEDEIIADPPGVLGANRGNPLLTQVVLKRFKGDDGKVEVRPMALEYLEEWVGKPHDRDVPEFDSLSGQEYRRVNEEDQRTVLVGIASSILRDYKSSHCTPLPREFYRIRN